MTFRIIDAKTGKEPTDRVITNIARGDRLIETHIDGFQVGEDGQIILVDDCGNCTWIDGKRFKAIPSAVDELLDESIKDAITEIQTEYNKHSDEWNYQAGLWFALDIIRKHTGV